MGGNTITYFCLETSCFHFNETIYYQFSDLENTVLMDMVLSYITSYYYNLSYIITRAINLQD